MTMRLIADEDLTAALARMLAATTRPGQTILLDGPVGAGKTHFARALIRARLGTYDYWQLNEHRRRFQDIGTAPFLRLAQLIRAKMADAEVVGTADVGPGVVTGDARVSFAIEAGRPQTRTLYHWRDRKSVV